MNQLDDAYRQTLADRSKQDADSYFGGGQPAPAPAAALAPAPPAPAPAAAAPPDAAPDAPAAPAPTGAPAAPAPQVATVGRTAPFPEKPEGYEFTTGGQGSADYFSGAPAPTPTTPPPATGVAAGSPSLVAQPAQAQNSSFTAALTAVAKDVGWGAVEAIPQYAIGGRLDFVKHAFGLATDLGNWVDKNLPMLSDPDAVAAQKENLKMGAVSDPMSAINNLIPEPTTWTGGAARGIGEFLTGFTPMLTVLKSGIGMGTTGATLLAGAYSSFVGTDPTHANMFNLLADKLPSPVADAIKPLAINPDDPALLNRAKEAAIGTLGGVLGEGVVKMARMYGAARRAAGQAAVQTPEATAAAAAEAQKGADFAKSINPPDEQVPLFTMIEKPSDEAVAANKLQDVKTAMAPGVPNQVLGRAVADAPAMPELKLNYSNITKDNLPDMAQQIGNAMIERISEAKRGEMPVEVTQALADKLGLTPETLLARPLGEAWSAEKIWGSAALLGQADVDLRALAQKAQLPGSSLADGFAFRQQLTYYAAMQESFLGVAGEAGRALGIFRQIHATGMLRQATAVQALIDKAGGLDNTRALAEVIANADNFSMASTVKQGWLATTSEAARTVEVTSMLMRPATQIRNVVGNALMMAQAAHDVSYARFLGNMFGTSPEEAISQAGVAGYIDAHYYALQNAFAAAGRSFAENESQFGKKAAGGAATAITDVGDTAMKPMAPSERFAAQRGWSDDAIKQFTDSGFGKAIDYISHGVTIAGRFLTSADDFFKEMTYSAKVRQLASDEGSRLGLTGADFENHVAERTLNPPPDMHVDASNWALWATFNNKAGPITQGFMKARDAMGPLGYLTFPFLRTPGNIASMAIQHSPLAPITTSFRNDLAAGGVARDMALAKMATGTAMLSTAIAWAESGIIMPTDHIDPAVSKLMGQHITGSLPNNPALADAYQALGMQKYAMRYGDKWISISGMGQIAPMLSYAADLAELKRSKDVRPDKNSSITDNIGLALAAVYGSMNNQSYFQGFSQIVNALNEAARGNEGSFSNYLNQTTASAIINIAPFAGGTMQATQKLWEPDAPYKKTFDLWSAVKAHTAGLSESVGPVRDGFGRPIPAASWVGTGIAGRLYDWFSPFRITQFQHSPIDEELVRLQNGIARIPTTDSFDGVKTDFSQFPEVFDMYQRLAGNEVKDRGFNLGLKDFLDGVVSGDDPRLQGQHQYYQTLMDSQGEALPGTKMAYIQSQVSRYKELAQEQIKAEAPDRYPDFYKWVTDEKQREATFQTGRGGVVAPKQDWSQLPGVQDPLPTQHTRPPPPLQMLNTQEPPPQQKTNGGGGAAFTVPSSNSR